MRPFILVILVSSLLVINISGQDQWEIVNEGGGFFDQIEFVNDQVGWMNTEGKLLKTEDGGETWDKVVFEKENSLYEIQICGNYGVMVGDQATIIATKDGGKTWDKVKTDLSPPYPWLAGAWIFPSNSAKVLSVGKGVILETGIGLK